MDDEERADRRSVAVLWRVATCVIDAERLRDARLAAYLKH
jgi:hypothetical protein